MYSWRPQSVLIECGCEERLSLTASEVICEECGAGHTGLLKQYLTESRLRGDEETHPWRYSLKSASGTSVPY